MEEKLKDTIGPETTNQRILRDIRAIQAELELVRVHCIELEKVIMMSMIDDENQQRK